MTRAIAGRQSVSLDEAVDGFTSAQSSTTSALTTKQRSTVAEHAQTPKIDSQVVQGGLPGLGEDTAIPPRGRRQRAPTQQPEPLLVTYEQRVVSRSSSKRTPGHYRWVIHNLLDLTGHIAGHSVSILDLLRDEALLGQTLATATTADGSREVCSWLAAQRRSVLRSFIRLMEPELRERGLSDAASGLARALRSVAEPVGTGYRLPVGSPRRRGGPVPSIEEAHAIQDELARKPDWRGIRNHLILELMIRRGLRIGGLLNLDGLHVLRLHDGRLRCFLQAKSKHQPYELAVPDDLVELFERYTQQFIAWARMAGLPDRVEIGVAGRFWRNDLGRPLTYPAWTAQLKSACQSAGVPFYTSHAFRRAFATWMTADLPRSTVASAGNWSSPRLMDDHYVQPSLTRLRASVARLPSRPCEGFSDTQEAEPFSPVRAGL